MRARPSACWTERLFRLEHADAGYNGHAVLTDISLEIRPGERVALVGKSGAGKSTLLAMLYEQQKGRAALIPQDSALVKSLSVFHNIFMGRLHRNATWYNLLNLAWPRSREVAGVGAVAERLELTDKLFTPTGELSGGQQQRTAVGRALYCGGDVVLGDEPVSSVDLHQAREVLSALCADYETIVLAMHDVELALSYTDRVIGLGDGGIVLDEASASLTPADLEPLYQG